MEGEFYGMQTFDQALLRHVQAGRVSMEDAMRVATSPHDFKLLVASEGRLTTSMDDVGGGAPAAETPSEPSEPVEPVASPPVPPVRPAPVPVAPDRPTTSSAPPGFG